MFPVRAVEMSQGRKGEMELREGMRLKVSFLSPTEIEMSVNRTRCHFINSFVLGLFGVFFVILDRKVSLYKSL